jgi:hypothetical protein
VNTYPVHTRVLRQDMWATTALVRTQVGRTADWESRASTS